MTLILQLAPGLNDGPQLLVSVKSPEELPVIAMLVIFRVTGPLFVIFTTTAALFVPIVCDPNPSLDGDRFVGPATLITAGAVRVAKEPVPVTVTIYGPGAIVRLDVMVSVADPPSELMDVGLKAQKSSVGAAHDNATDCGAPLTSEAVTV